MYVLHLERAPHGITRYLLASAASFLDAYRFARSSAMYGAPRVTRIEWAPDAYVDQPMLRNLLEDVLVATTRFRWAARRGELSKGFGRQRQSKSAAAVADMEAHRAELARCHAWLAAAGGEGLISASGRKGARAAARDRLANDASHHRCMCSAAACRHAVPKLEIERAARGIYRRAGVPYPGAEAVA